MRVLRSLAWMLVVATFCAALAAPVLAQKPKTTDILSDPYTEGGKPELLQAAGIVSTGGFPFGKKGRTTVDVDKFLITQELRWFETEHFRIGAALDSYQVKLEDKKKIMAELTRLKAKLPKVNVETKILDPWLRMHLMAQRCEEAYTRFVEIIDGENLQFTQGEMQAGPYRGEGPYLGMKDKYEVFILSTETAQVDWLLENAGLRIKNAQRWHFIDRGCISIVLHTMLGKLRNDAALHGAVVFNLAHNLYDGLNHYTYDTPIWIHEGLAHFMEREVNPNHNSFDSGEGAVADMTSKTNWRPEVVKIIQEGSASRMAELMQMKSYSELKLVHHFATWSMVDFLIETKPKEFAQFLWQIKRNFDARGVPTGENLNEWHRRQFKGILGWSYAEFDEAWRAWVLSTYTKPAGKGKDKAGKEGDEKEGEKEGAGKAPPAAGKGEKPPPKPAPAGEGTEKDDPAGGAPRSTGAALATARS